MGYLFSDRPIFLLLLVLLVVAPLFFGATPAAIWGILTGYSCLLGIAWLVLWSGGQVELTSAFKDAWLMNVLFGLWLTWIGLQILPIPMEWLAMISPKSHENWLKLYQFQNQVSHYGTISVSPHDTYQAMIKTVGYIMIFNMVLLLVNSQSRIQILLWIIVGSGVFQAFYGSLMVLSGIEHIFWHEKVSYRGRVTGTFINRNHLAAYLVLCFFSGIGLMLSMMRYSVKDRSREDRPGIKLRYWVGLLLSKKFILRLFLILMVIALVMTRSRMGNISFLVALLATSLLGFVFIQSARKGLMILVISILIVDIAVIGAWFGVDKVIHRVDRTIVQHTDKAKKSPRIADTDLHLTDTTAALLAERGLVYRDIKPYLTDYRLGSGLGTFHIVYPAYKSREVTHYYDHAHNDYYQFMAEIGLPGLVLLGMLLIIPLIVALYVMMKQKSQIAKAMVFVPIASIIALLLHASVDFNLQIPAYVKTVMVILAMPYLFNRLALERQSRVQV